MAEDLRKQFRNNVLRAKYSANIFYFITAGLLTLILWPHQPIQQQYASEIFVICLFLLFTMNAFRQTNNVMEIVDEIIITRGLVTDFDEVSTNESINLNGIFFKLTNASATLKALFATSKDGELAKEVDWKGGEIYTTRGKDPRGPADGHGADTFGEILTRVDAMTIRPEYEGIEGPLTKTEKMVEAANEIATEKALKDWEAAEAADPELIEAGVDKLGDLVASGHYKGPENKP